MVEARIKRLKEIHKTANRNIFWSKTKFYGSKEYNLKSILKAGPGEALGAKNII